MKEAIDHILDVEERSSRMIDEARHDARKAVEDFRIELEKWKEDEKKNIREENAEKKRRALDDARKRAGAEVAAIDDDKRKLFEDIELCRKAGMMITDMLLE